MQWGVVCSWGGHTSRASVVETRGDEGAMGTVITAVPSFCSAMAGL